jgi:hypothetical protein
MREQLTDSRDSAMTVHPAGNPNQLRIFQTGK